jgi:hypothetical protein
MRIPKADPSLKQELARNACVRSARVDRPSTPPQVTACEEVTVAASTNYERGLQGESKVFFFEKKKQKTFIVLSALWGNAGLKKQKFFASFFQKRRPFFLKRLAIELFLQRL